MHGFTREDELKLDILRGKEAIGELLPEDVKLLEHLEQKYAVFIDEGVKKLKMMAPYLGKRTVLARYILLLWPMLWLTLCLFFIALYLLQSQSDGEEKMLRVSILWWHVRLVAVLLGVVTLLGLKRMRECAAFNRVALGVCVFIAGVLGLWALYRFVDGCGAVDSRCYKGMYGLFFLVDAVIVMKCVFLLLFWL